MKMIDCFVLRYVLSLRCFWSDMLDEEVVREQGVYKCMDGVRDQKEYIKDEF